MPIDGPVTNPQEAAEKLRQCSVEELKRARRHHRRALKSLQNGGYGALSDGTRDDLIERLRTELEALNQALNEPNQTPDESTTGRESDGTSDRPLSFVSLRSLTNWLW